jgi:hypothetical protein
VIIEHIMYILHILHIWNSYTDACLSLRPQVSTIAWPFSKQLLAAWYSLTDEEPVEILSCSDIPVLTAFMEGVFRQFQGGRAPVRVCHAKGQGIFPDGTFSSRLS